MDIQEIINTKTKELVKMQSDRRSVIMDLYNLEKDIVKCENEISKLNEQQKANNTHNTDEPDMFTDIESMIPTNSNSQKNEPAGN